MHGLPLVAVNHLEAHALTVGLTEGLRPPYLLLLVSGGHTQLLIVHGVGRYQRLGTTIDDALGEAFDKTAKLLGPRLSRRPGGGAGGARRASAGRFALPRPMLGRAEPHFSFAGLKTAVRHQAQALVPLTDAAMSPTCAPPSRRPWPTASPTACAGPCAIADERLGAATAGTWSWPAASPPTCSLRAALADGRRTVPATRCTCRRRRCAPTMPPWSPGPAPSGWRAAGPTASTSPARARWPLDPDAIARARRRPARAPRRRLCRGDMCCARLGG